MPRVTISLSDRTYRALKEAAARQNRFMGSIIEESLERRGIGLYVGIWRSSSALLLHWRICSRHVPCKRFPEQPIPSTLWSPSRAFFS